jgi:hypothetical protein
METRLPEEWLLAPNRSRPFRTVAPRHRAEVIGSAFAPAGCGPGALERQDRARGLRKGAGSWPAVSVLSRSCCSIPLRTGSLRVSVTILAKSWAMRMTVRYRKTRRSMGEEAIVFDGFAVLALRGILYTLGEGAEQFRSSWRVRTILLMLRNYRVLVARMKAPG